MVEFSKVVDALHERYVDQADARTGPKYESLYQAILTAIRDGLLAPGDRLPSEQVLSQRLPISQVTVRKCFELLAQRGVISREHGRGTFVSTAEHSVSDLWHFRFKDPDRDGYLPIFNRILSRTKKRDAKLARRLDCKINELVRIERAVNIGSRFNCYSELYLPACKFARIMDEPISELERINLKDILAREYRTPTLWVDQNVRVGTLPKDAVEPMGVPEGRPVLCLNVTGYTFEDQPISFQRIWIPETSYELNLPASAETVLQRKPDARLKVVVANG